jgi:hypothetical protein
VGQIFDWLPDVANMFCPKNVEVSFKNIFEKTYMLMKWSINPHMPEA